MKNPSIHSYSSYTRKAATLLGQEIRRARMVHRVTAEELAARAGLTRGLVHRIERGDLGCSIGAVFEAAAVVGIRLFEEDEAGLTTQLSTNATTQALLPRRIRKSTKPVKDDF